MLPHEMFSAIFHFYPKVWLSSIMPSKETLKKFWGAVSGHPQMKEHPLHGRAHFQESTIPVAVHGDGVPITGIGKGWSRVMTLFSWYIAWLAREQLQIYLFGYGVFTTNCLQESYTMNMAAFSNFPKYWNGAFWPYGRGNGLQGIMREKSLLALIFVNSFHPFVCNCVLFLLLKKLVLVLLQ